jgi:hypothetical protein
LGNAEGKGCTEREWRWRDTAKGRGKGDGKDHFEGSPPSRVPSTLPLCFGRRLALASSWMFKLVDRLNDEEVGFSPGVSFANILGPSRRLSAEVVGLCPEREAMT